MQPVGLRSSTLALSLAEPAHLPVRFGGTIRHIATTANRNWVLHRKIGLRLIAALFASILIAFVFQARGGIINALIDVRGFMTGEFATGSFGISRISITGQILTSEGDILSALAIDDKTSTVSFDAEAARARLLNMPAIAEVNIRKVYPGQVIVTVTERKPVARWRIDGLTFAVDAAGEQIADATSAEADLPLVIGDGAGPAAFAMVQALNRFPDLANKIAALSRIADRRWDIIYRNGLRVQLPERDVVAALRNLEAYEADHALMDRDLSLIDLRVPGSLVVRLNTPAAETTKTTGGRP